VTRGRGILPLLILAATLQAAAAAALPEPRISNTFRPLATPVARSSPGKAEACETNTGQAT